MQLLLTTATHIIFAVPLETVDVRSVDGLADTIEMIVERKTNQIANIFQSFGGISIVLCIECSLFFFWTPNLFLKRFLVIKRGKGQISINENKDFILYYFQVDERKLKEKGLIDQ